jgi:hypothetical protein
MMILILTAMYGSLTLVARYSFRNGGNAVAYPHQKVRKPNCREQGVADVG